MKKSSYTDKLFRDSVLQDKPNIEPNKSIEARLNNYFLIKNTSRKVHSNSFEGAFLNMFSTRFIGYLAGGVAAACLGYSLFIGNINTKPINQQYADSCYQNTFALDTNLIVKDTCR